MTVFYEGWNVDLFARGQTLSKRRKRPSFGYSGDDELSFDAFDFMPEFPLEVRVASFDRRLAAAIAKRGDRN